MAFSTGMLRFFMTLCDFGTDLQVAVIGATGGIGAAFLRNLTDSDSVSRIFAYSRQKIRPENDKMESFSLDITQEESIKTALGDKNAPKTLDIIINATGILHNKAVQPEKSLKDIDFDRFQHIYAVNTIGQALIMKHFLPLLPREKRGVYGVLSARIGSISDNQIGGWYAYRSSKAALNMLIKTAAIEMGRRYKQCVIVGLHPGTVDTNLSKPFQGFVPDHKLFTPDYAAQRMLQTLDGLVPSDSGKIFAYDGREILP